MATKVKKLLIANRGEIACRIIRTAKNMGIQCVAIYSDSDVNSPHVSMADESYCIGGSIVSQSYCNIERICEAVQATKADAVHPGYGFLSENYNFVRRLELENINFVGPSANSIRLMADKLAAKKTAVENGVNVVPGQIVDIQSINAATQMAESIGFPVIIKAKAGGGGKGMRVVRDYSEIQQAVSSATNEAMKNFSDGTIFMEKFIENPRHIEVQILADKKGNIICLGERDCSIQRHNQKIIEETPYQDLVESRRQQMYNQCIKLAQAVDYYSAGTIEFVVDKQQNFYFLEMNTRLQVEHPITEMVTGVDIVKEMIRISQCEELTIRQESMKTSGHAIEARIYAENPAKNFLPTVGRISNYQQPEISSNVRIESGICKNSEVSIFYDSMLVKVCTHGKDRIGAIELMRQALSEMLVEGIITNIEFLEAIFRSKRFVQNDIDTGFIQDNFKAQFNPKKLNAKYTRNFVAIGMLLHLTAEYKSYKLFSSNKKLSGTYAVVIGETVHQHHANYDGHTLTTTINDEVLNVVACGRLDDGISTIHVNNKKYRVRIRRIGVNKYALSSESFMAECSVYEARLLHALEVVKKNVTEIELEPLILSPIDGLVSEISVEEGETVEPGQKLCVIEAMKMENVIRSTHSCKIMKIKIEKDSTVKSGSILMEVSFTQ